MALQMHPQIYEFDRDIRKISSILSQSTPDAEEEKPEDVSEKVVNIELLAELKKWRLKRASNDSVPAYVVAHDSVLETVATKLPSSEQALLGVKGFGGRKVEQYGEDILSIVAKHTGTKTTDKPAKNSNWTPNEDELLKKLVKQQRPLDDVCAKLNKTPEEVWSRIHRLLKYNNT